MISAAFCDQVRGGLIVSCQALPDEPLFGAQFMARMAFAAQQGGARAIRANTPADIAAIRKAVTLPIIGLYKAGVPGYDIYITPTLDHALAIAAAGADLIAIDATDRPHPEGPLAEFITAIHDRTGLPVLADISTLAEARAAQAAGADIVATTMSGYAPGSPRQTGPDVTLVHQAAARLDIPVIAEGRYHSPAEARLAVDNGALAVVVGGAITRPQEITRRFAAALQELPPGS